MIGTPSAPHTRANCVRYNGAKQISPALAYVEREDPSGEIFMSTRFLARSVGHIINIHDNIMYAYVNKIKGKAADDDTHAEIHANSTIKITKEQLSNNQRQQLARAVECFEDECLQMFSMVDREGNVI